MLKSLEIHNYVIIDEIFIQFHPQMNILTGETGAGKSIILGALNLLTGERADITQLLHKETKCTIEGIFDISKASLQSFFTAHDLEYEPETIIRREILPGGKSRAFVNDSPVNLSVLKSLSEYLIDIHSQNESLELKSADFQLRIVDAYASNELLLDTYSTLFQVRKKKQKELDQLIEDTKKSNFELDYLQFQYKELKEASLEEIQLQKEEEELKTLEHAEEIKSTLFQVTQMLENGDSNVSDAMLTATQLLHKISKYNTDIASISARFDQWRLELKELSKDIAGIEENTELNQERIVDIQERLNIVYKLLKKHQAHDIASLIQIREEIEKRLDNIQGANERIDPLTKEIHVLGEELLHQAEEISKRRKSVIAGFESKIKLLLQSLGMANAQFVIYLETNPQQLTSHGIDQVRFMFAANKGSQLQELKKAISGGEMSRFMLSLKTMMAEKIQLPTLIFDEIDTGVSGDIAFKVGELLEQLSKHHQLIAITHLPQLASKGKHHLFVYKETDDKKTNTKIKLLLPEERKTEVAKMLSGEKITDTALANAAELLGANP